MRASGGNAPWAAGQELSDLVRTERRGSTERRHLRERGRCKLVRVRARQEQCPRSGGVVRERRDVERGEAVGASLGRHWQAVALAREDPVPGIERRVRGADRLERLPAATVEGAHHG